MTGQLMMRGSYADTPQGRIHYREAGDGDAVVLIHGGQMDSTSWMRLAPALAESHRVIAIDCPASGLSDAPSEEPADLSFYSNAVVGLLDALALDRASLGGFHIGSSIAVDVAASHGDRVAKLIPIGLFAAETQEERDSVNATFDLDDALVADPEWIVRDFETTPLVARPDDPEWYAAQLTGRLLAGPRTWWLYRALFRYDIVSAMRRVTCPTLIVHLEGDALPAEVARRGLEHINGARWQSLEVDHPFSELTNPTRLAPVLRAFLAN